MDKEKIGQYRAKLLEEKANRLKELLSLEKEHLRNTTREASGDLSAYSIHMADQAGDSFESEKNIRLYTEKDKILAEIEDALYRMEQGKYGVCTKCGKDISSPRLDAKPYAYFCIDCARAAESQRYKK